MFIFIHTHDRYSSFMLLTGFVGDVRFGRYVPVY